VTEVPSAEPSVEETTDWSLHEAMAAATISTLNKAKEGACIPRPFTRSGLPLNPTRQLFRGAMSRINPAMGDCLSYLQTIGIVLNSSDIPTFVGASEITDISSMVGASRTLW